jgi:Domain of unknown function (DUF4234)
MSQTPPPPPATAGGTRPVGVIRTPLGVLGLSIITCGIYGIYWQYKTFQEMKDYSGEGVGGVVGLLLALVCGVITWFLLPSEIAGLYERDGKEKPVTPATGFWVLVPLIGYFIWLWKVQGALNDFWTSKGAVKK